MMISGELILFIILIVVAVLVIALLRALFILLPAIVVAAIIWFLTHNLTWTAVAFLIIAILSAVKRI